MLLWLNFCNLAGQLVTLLVNFPTHHFLITPPLIATPSFCVILSNRHLTIKLSLEVFGLILLVLTVIPPLRCVLKRDSSIPCMVHNLSFPPRQSVNDGIKPDTYLDAPFKLHLPGLDKLVEFINSKGCWLPCFQKGSHACLSKNSCGSTRLSPLGLYGQWSVLFSHCYAVQIAFGYLRMLTHNKSHPVYS